VSLALAISPQRRLNLVLKFTNRRVDEISQLLAHGKGIDNRTSDRFKQELDDALELAAQLNDMQIQSALVEIKHNAESQGMTMQQLITSLPPQADPAIQHLQDRLNEQIQISGIGEKNPSEFREQVRERQRQHQQNKHSAETEEPGLAPSEISVTPMPKQDGQNHGSDMNPPTGVPGHGGQDNGPGESPPGNGNHGQNLTHTPKP
jgi:hypothetical protein